jgi:uracil-DNA glycosylase family 4
MPIFSPTIWSKQKHPLSLVPECGTCQLHKDCKSPFMKVSGKGKRKILLVAEGPGKTEDDRGIPLVGPAGMEMGRLLSKVGIEMRHDCWITNAVICRPHYDDDKNRKPSNDEVKYCRPNLLKTIRELQPIVIIPLGESAMTSVAPLAGWEKEVKDITRWTGWEIPSIRLNSWICPTYHPSFVLREKDRNQALELHILKHLRAACSHKERPWAKVPEWDSRVFVELNHRKAAGAIKSLAISGQPVAFDYESNMLKPDSKDAQILCCSISDGKVSIGFPWMGDAIWEMQKVLQDPTIPKVGQSYKFEERWTRRILGHGVKNWMWDCMLAAHWLDCKRGICSLKFQAFVQLGAEDYSSHLDDYMGDGNSNKQNRLKEVEPADLLKYCALDSLFTMMIFQRQQGKNLGTLFPGSCQC